MLSKTWKLNTAGSKERNRDSSKTMAMMSQPIRSILGQKYSRDRSLQDLFPQTTTSHAASADSPGLTLALLPKQGPMLSLADGEGVNKLVK